METGKPSDRVCYDMLIAKGLFIEDGEGGVGEVDA